MYQYYSKAEICYVYLTDVLDLSGLSNSRWFTRGWTLQELLAPSKVNFYSSNGQLLGDKHELRAQIKVATAIDIGDDLNRVPLVKQFEWSLARNTTKLEDKSYCLVGMLDISLIPNYGEGEDAARERLFDEVAKEHGRKTVKQLQQVYLEYTTALPSLKSGKNLIEDALKLLYFENMDSRRLTIEDPFPKSCEWLLKDERYLHWLSMTGDHFLWIKGKPGAGKSTLMKYAELHSPRGDFRRISFFFNARGNNLDKSVFGMYRSLVYQLLTQVRDSGRLLKGSTADMILQTKGQWQQHQLKSLILCLVLESTDRVQCFVDALDECETEEIQDMIYFLGDVARTSDRLFICFASRFYPTITIKGSTELLLHNPQHTRALEQYIHGRLDVPDSLQGNELRQQLIAKANGVFFWAFLVVNLLNRELSKGNIFNLEKTLDELPSELNELLQEIVAREPTDQTFISSLRWILIAAQPLDVKEYYCAMLTSLHDAEVVEDFYRQKWSLLGIGDKQLDNFVSSSSRGLAEVTHRRTVQLIHESVADFLWTHEGLAILGVDVREGALHDYLKTMCIKYLTMVPFEEQKDSMEDDFPLYDYAVNSIIYHADQAHLDISQDDFVNELEVSQIFVHLQDSVEYWLAKYRIDDRLGNIIGRNPLCTSRDKIGVQHVLAFYNSGRLSSTAQAVGRQSQYLDGASSLLIAVAREGLLATNSLLSCKVDVNEICMGLTALGLSTSVADRTISSYLILAGADVNVRDDYGFTPLLLESRNKQDSTILKLLLEAKADTEAVDGTGRTALMLALEHHARTETVQILLEAGVPVNAVDHTGKTAFMLAIEFPHTTSTLELLLASGADIDRAGNSGRSLLDWLHWDFRIQYRKRLRGILFLLEHQRPAGLDQRNAIGETVLMLACGDGNVELVEMFLRHGASLDVADHRGKRAIDYAKEYGETNDNSEMLRLLQPAWADCQLHVAF